MSRNQISSVIISSLRRTRLTSTSYAPPPHHHSISHCRFASSIPTTKLIIFQSLQLQHLSTSTSISINTITTTTTISYSPTHTYHRHHESNQCCTLCRYQLQPDTRKVCVSILLYKIEFMCSYSIEFGVGDLIWSHHVYLFDY